MPFDLSNITHVTGYPVAPGSVREVRRDVDRFGETIVLIAYQFPGCTGERMHWWTMEDLNTLAPTGEI